MTAADPGAGTRAALAVATGSRSVWRLPTVIRIRLRQGVAQEHRQPPAGGSVDSVGVANLTTSRRHVQTQRRDGAVMVWAVSSSHPSPSGMTGAGQIVGSRLT